MKIQLQWPYGTSPCELEQSVEMFTKIYVKTKLVVSIYCFKILYKR